MLKKIKKEIMFTKSFDIETLTFSAGVHGNELSGSIALLSENIPIEGLKLNKQIVSMPRINFDGIQKNSRYDKDGNDMNRLYGMDKKVSENTKNVIDFVEDVVLKSYCVIDFHEAKGYRVRDRTGNGNTIITENNDEFAEFVVNEINKDIPEDNKFLVYKNKKPIKGTLREFCTKNKIKYCLIEVSNEQPLLRRVKICKDIIRACIKYTRSIDGSKDL
tara:strand:+ start:2367 stop:3020 length:654 start_codon:yes stop_codon:yes gene_type:complete